MIDKITIVQALRYGSIGFLNTGITFLVIIVLKEFAGLSLYTANIIGYIAGLMNSFIWNRSWTFKADDGHIKKQAILFIAVWGICYLLQLAILYLCTELFGIYEYLSVFIGMVTYTGISFILNKFITFNTNPIGEEK